MKFMRRPIVVTFTLFVIVSVIYFMTSATSSARLSLGPSLPLNLKKNFNIQDQALKDVEEAPPLPDEPAVAPAPMFEEEPDAGQQVLEETKSDSKKDMTEVPFMPKMGNATLRAELGRSTWKLFHTILARYPEKPNNLERKTLETFIQLFAQVYPCGDCARHFTGLLAKYPPQTTSRKAAALWGCDVHNKVNEKLHKPEYDCSKILTDYDCGCGEDEKAPDYTLGNQSMDKLRNIDVDEKADTLQMG
ncbi:uncharacterized protein SPAPADRAFT_63641 [Spathaspora passalidarum NRRL Y-27907]|uniref:Sulfhydryl oxidase n=1 Tax=Spathaspora passalidarum (strain NRRL Y-27907 / 11-Y1) TaxID=619300 RepID=G3AUT3_SPAPN|nr:uncharacterized protein SPAPADRAFT_63641 [Spathaspora passalidarum NRRL Y-27907]EGW30023.1 hypothetical protein SPAPADRAFT_63641 [Spathaspora passalidarum NRRL Y-27907]